MFRFSGFTQKANNAINVAMAEAGAMGHSYIGSEHLILGMLDRGSGVAHTVLAEKNVTFDSFRRAIIQNAGGSGRTSLTPEDFTPRCKRTLEMSIIKARIMGHGSVGTEHILMVLAKEKDSCAVRLLLEHGVDIETLVESMADSICLELAESAAFDRDRSRRSVLKTSPPPVSPPAGQPTPNIDKYSRDLTARAHAGGIDPVIGRDAEVERIIQILSRRTKNNPCLIGEAGVGKTAVVEGLAQRIADGNVPDVLIGKRLLSLDLTSMVAGAKYRGDFEDRVKNVVDEASGNSGILLFIDELHTIMGAGAAEGAIDAANILKPQLARGELCVIGATTITEYRRYIEKDAALERRFQSVMVEEPSEERTKEILRGIRPKYEAHHGICITDEAEEAAVSLSARYIPDRFLPDKAIDLIDEAGARLRLRMSGALERGGGDDLKIRLIELDREMESAIRSQDFELAASIRDRERVLKARIRETQGLTSGDIPRLEACDVAELVSCITGIDVTSLSRSAAERYATLERDLGRSIVGQGHAVKAVCSAIRRGRAGFSDPARPCGSFIFLGPTGVGKTELCCVLAKSLFSHQDALIRLDMSEYMEKHAVSKLIGSPPGHIVYDEGGQLTEKIRRRPYAVVLFDEVEKAHPDVWGLLLQILDNGSLTDAQGRTVSFKNAVIILTSNVGARHIAEQKGMGFLKSEGAEKSEEEIRRDVMGELKKLMRPELLNRLDDIIVFSRLTRDEIREITRKLLSQLTARAKGRGVELVFTDMAVEQICIEGCDSAYGARPLRRVIQRRVEDLLAHELLRGKLAGGGEILCDYRDGFVLIPQPAEMTG